MLTMTRGRDGWPLLVIECDQCERPIDQVGLAAYLWPACVMVGIEAERIVFAHKPCMKQWEQAHGGRDAWHWQELTYLPVELGAALGIDWAFAGQAMGVDFKAPATPAGEVARWNKVGEGEKA